MILTGTGIINSKRCPAEIIPLTSAVNYMKFEDNLTASLGTDDVASVNDAPAYVAGYYGQGIDKSLNTVLTLNADTQPANTPSWSIAYWHYMDPLDPDPANMENLIWDTWNYAGAGARQGFRLYPYRIVSGVQQLFATMGNDNIFISYPKVAYQQWHHFCVTLNTSRVLRIYVDGVSKGTGSWSGETLNRAGIRPRIFGRISDNVNTFGGRGVVDELMIFNRTLSATDVLTLYQSTCPLTTP